MAKPSPSPCRQLCSIFQHNSTAPSKTSAGLLSNAPISFKEKAIKTFVTDFKQKSTSSDFRALGSQYKAAVRRLARGDQFPYIHEILDHQKQYPEIKDEQFTSRIIRLYGAAKMPDHAIKLFDEMPDLNCPRTVVSLNALLAACMPFRNFHRAIELYHQWTAKLSIKPDVITYSTVIKAYCEVGMLDEAMSMLKEMEEHNVAPNTITFDTLLSTYYNKDRFLDAEKLWLSMEEKNLVPDLRCYSSRLRGMVNTDRLQEAMKIFEEMKENGLKPNTYFYNLVIKGVLEKKGDLDEAKKWYRAMMDSGCTPDFVTIKTVIPYVIDEDIDIAFELCRVSVGLKNKLSCGTVQRVINKLVEKSQGEKAKQLVELFNSAKAYKRRKLFLTTATNA